MKSSTMIFVLTVLILSLSCQHEPTLAPTQIQPEAQNLSSTNSKQIALEVIHEFNWLLEESKSETQTSLQKPLPACLTNFKRRKITGNIVHYSFQVSRGSHLQDKIGIHRVVKETRMLQPVKTRQAICLQHGDGKTFEGMFLPGLHSASTPQDFGFAVFLAQNDVDVWGIDQAWTLVPTETGDFSFMADWGLQKQVDDLEATLAIARFTRLLTGCGYGQLFLLGYSSGVATGYALLNQEATLPLVLRNVQGFVAADLPIKTDNEDLRQVWTSEFNNYKTKHDAGEYAEFVPLNLAGTLAKTDPDGESPMIPGFTNLQTALFFGAGPLFGVIPFHYLAGNWENDLPVGLQFVTIDQWLDFMEYAPTYEAMKFMYETYILLGDLADSPFDDNFSMINVPIFNVCPAGGCGELSTYGASFLGTTDVTHHFIQLRSPEEALFDYGHIDIFLAPNAQNLFWEPLVNWLHTKTLGPTAFSGENPVQE